ncbi:hypothetical protein [Janthinobacterium sp. P210005]|uniref:hypothetical protein n=1 Tax=Janthinobacterium sp. P210005 TaxID=3112938 RepID=UPI002E275707|nr:hypothetical protein [Janthinobacterium sp. P210005]
MNTFSNQGLVRRLRCLEKRLAQKAEQRENSSIAAHIAAVNASLGKPSKRRQGRAEPMPYRLHIAVAFASLAVAFASLASALFSLYWSYP